MLSYSGLQQSLNSSVRDVLKWFSFSFRGVGGKKLHQILEGIPTLCLYFLLHCKIPCSHSGSYSVRCFSNMIRDSIIRCKNLNGKNSYYCRTEEREIQDEER